MIVVRPFNVVAPVTPSVPLICVLPNVEVPAFKLVIFAVVIVAVFNIVLPDTFNEVKLVAPAFNALRFVVPVTVKLLLIVVAPVTPSVPLI